ncbi:MAG TPA: hypothetical protein VJ276_20190 [Thermoanaerobaculia bacterium]|nr:hypothetical protein [Thermoanaerobaculia bacterium]
MIERRGPTILILGGAGMVGLQVAREAARELRPSKIVIASLRDDEVREAIDFLSEQIEGVELVGAAGDIFIPQSLQGRRRDEIVRDTVAYEELFTEIFSRDADYKKSAMWKLIEEHQPQIIVDCINTATAISYQDEFKVAQKTYSLLRTIEEATDADKLARLPDLIGAVRELLISQGVPQIARHILFLHRALSESHVQVYVKVGTTGTGGMGINIPYTHSEDKPSLQLLAKSAIGFAHTGLLFLLARTPGTSEERHGATIKEVKPGAMIGFKRVAARHITLRGERTPAYLVSPREEELGARLQLRDEAGYGRFQDRDVKLEIIGADTGENGFFSIGEFQAITYPRQMEYVTPEEVARTVVLEILGASTGRDVLAAIDGAITEPSYRAGVLREHAIQAMQRLEERRAGEVLPSIAIGHLGPPKLSKLLAEAHLILGAAGTDEVEAIRRIPPAELQAKVEAYLAAHPEIVSEIITIGVPMLRDRDGRLVLTRGPRVSIPPPPADGTVVPLDAASIERHAATGWVDLRLGNFELWQRRLGEIKTPEVERYGSAALDVKGYAAQRFVPGDVVGWLLTNETDEQGMVGRRLF